MGELYVPSNDCEVPKAVDANLNPAFCASDTVQQWVYNPHVLLQWCTMRACHTVASIYGLRTFTGGFASLS